MIGWLRRRWLRKSFGTIQREIGTIPLIVPIHKTALNRADFTATTWLALQSWAIDEIEKARRKNDALKNSADDTAALRGEIRALKRLLALPKDLSAPPHAEPEQYE